MSDKCPVLGAFLVTPLFYGPRFDDAPVNFVKDSTSWANPLFHTNVNLLVAYDFIVFNHLDIFYYSS